MPVKIESYGIENLSVQDRLDLIEQIWNSLPDQVNIEDIPDWHVAELAKRRAALGNGKPWREVLDAIQNQE